MELQLKNVGMIKEANVKIDGLTVLAGENDTGKSTVGKALYFAYKSNSNVDYEVKYDKSNNPIMITKEVIIDLYKSIFYFEKTNNTNIVLKDNKNIYFDLNKGSVSFNIIKNNKKVILIETPIITNLFTHFSKLDTIQNDIDYELNNYPTLTRELYKQLKLELKKEDKLEKSFDLLNKLKYLINGEMLISGDEIKFKRENKEFNVNAVATGIKSFGIIQLLIKNGYLSKDSVLILDEPEVHLHPKWQLEYAKIIIELVKNGVRVVVNSRSPYMIEALKRYSEVEEIMDKTNFYLAEDGYIKKVNDNNSKTLEKIFEKLSEPFDTFEEMDMERLLNG